MFLLDTDHIGIIQAKVQPEYVRLLTRMAQYPADQFFVPIISFHEQLSGWNSYLNKARTTADVVKAYKMFEETLREFTETQLLSFDTIAGRVFDSLISQKIRVGTMDLRIASIALTHDMTVLTRNLNDFRKIPRLKVEDWTKAAHQ